MHQEKGFFVRRILANFCDTLYFNDSFSDYNSPLQKLSSDISFTGIGELKWMHVVTNS